MRARIFLVAAVAGALCLVPGLASAAKTASATPVVTRLGLPTNDLAFDPISNRLYASIPSRAGVLGNRIAALDPASGAVLGTAFVGSEPGKLAVSSDGQYLYVALDGAAAVRRVALPSLTPGLQFPLGVDAILGPMFVEDMEVVPGAPTAVAISRRNVGFSPRHEGVAVYDDGVKRANETPGHTGSNVIEFGASASRLYGYNNETTEFGFRRMTVTGTGVTTQDVAASLISGFGVDMEFDDGRMYATNGRVIDPEARTLLGTFPFPSAGPIEPDTAHGKVFHVAAER
ncbi:MAG TPA: hypothetical protein VJT84_00225 [Gaiellaceae bacterium]|nr:hypothetical protein [Gaiellaceae bacterium]